MIILNKTLKFHNLTIVVRSAFQENNKYYRVIKMLQYEKIDVLKGLTLINQTNQKNV